MEVEMVSQGIQVSPAIFPTEGGCGEGKASGVLRGQVSSVTGQITQAV